MIKDVIMRWGQDWGAHPGCPEVGFEEIIHWFPRSPSLDREEAPKGSRITSALPTIRPEPRISSHNPVSGTHVREADSPPSGRVPGHDGRNSWSVAKRLSYRQPRAEPHVSCPS